MCLNFFKVAVTQGRSRVNLSFTGIPELGTFHLRIAGLARKGARKVIKTLQIGMRDGAGLSTTVTDAPSTDFTAKLVDVDPAGTARIVADGIRRMSSEDQAGWDGKVHVSPGAVGHVFGKGHRIRLDISSSNFPKFDRNLNTGASGLVSSNMRPARQVVRLGGLNGSKLTPNLLKDRR